jgi:hypothetical protein
MLQSLLIDRFKMKIHYEERTVTEFPFSEFPFSISILDHY